MSENRKVVVKPTTYEDELKYVKSTYMTPKLVKQCIDDLHSTVEKEIKFESEHNKLLASDLCEQTYRRYIVNFKNVYFNLNWFQKLLWRILGLNRLWIYEEY